MEKTVKGDIKTAIDGFIIYDDSDETGTINLVEMVNSAIKRDRKDQKRGTGFHRSYETGERITSWFGSTLEKNLEIDTNKVKQILKPILDIYITSNYDKGSDVNEKNLRIIIEKMLKYTLDDFEKEGYYWRGY